jgi:hypothetical protein
MHPAKNTPIISTPIRSIRLIRPRIEDTKIGTGERPPDKPFEGFAPETGLAGRKSIGTVVIRPISAASLVPRSAKSGQSAGTDNALFTPRFIGAVQRLPNWNDMTSQGHMALAKYNATAWRI